MELITHREKTSAANDSKSDYLRSIESFIAKRQTRLKDARKSRAAEIILHPDESRKSFIDMLGYPLTEEAHMPISAVKTLIASERDIDIYRVKLEIFEDFCFYGLFFQIRNKRLPLVIVQHGGLGTPELCSGFYDSGSSNYNDMTERILKKGVDIFAPQLLLWDKKTYGIEYDRAKLDAELKQLGGSIAALEIYCIKCALSYFASLECIDADNIGMAGLSYGGFYTMFTMAADTRIKAALCCSFFNDRYEYPWIDWVWKGSAERFLDSEIALLCYPRKLCIAVGTEDEAFDISHARAEYSRLIEECGLCNIDASWLEFEEFKGKHEFCKSDELLDALINTLRQDL